MAKSKKNDTNVLGLILGFLGFIFFVLILDSITSGDEPGIFKPTKDTSKDNYIHILSSFENSSMEDEIKNYAKKEKIDVEFTYMGDIDIVDELNADPSKYDAVWISNSMWLYMLNNSYLYSELKSVSVSPVIFGVKKSKAQALGLIGKDVTNSDMVKLIQDKKMSYVMSSVTRTNTGATAYFGFVQSLAGNPEVLSVDHLKDKTLQENLKAIFSGVERVSGDEDYLKKMFINSDEFEAVIADESALIEINKQLEKNNKEQLYFIYPSDGVAINDSAFAFISSNKDKLENFRKIQTYLLSKDGRNILESKGKRTWYGGVSDKANKEVFKPSWGIDTTKPLLVTKYPSKNVMNEALNTYINLLRKPTHVVFCLDFSGSMAGSRMEDLKGAMSYILDPEQTAKDRLQFSEFDKISIVMFETEVREPIHTMGNNTKELSNRINTSYPGGATALFPSVESALKILMNEDDKYTKVVIAMTDGEANVGTFTELQNFYNRNKLNIPIYSISFGDALERDLDKMSKLSNGKTFNGKTGLLQAFKEVRGYN